MLSRRHLEMTISREEFVRLFAAVVPAFELDGETIRWPGGAGGGGTIRLVPLADRRLGSVVVSRHRIEITLQARTVAEEQAFMNRFHRAFLRGGG